MNKKMVLIALPIALMPYLILLTLASIFFYARCPFLSWIMDVVFHRNLWYLVAALFICCILTAVFSIVCFAVSISKNWDALSMVKTAMIVKLVQVPAYILIFVLGAFFVIAIWTIPFSIGLFLADCLTVFMTGVLVASSFILSIRQGYFSAEEVLWVILLQFVFCADVISSVIFYRKLKNRSRQEQLLNSEAVPLNG